MTNWNQGQIDEFRANNGVLGGRFEGQTYCLLTTTGAKSGNQSTQVLGCVELDGRRFVLASLMGAPKNPAWYHNLVANPTVTVEFGADTYQATATPLDAAERAEIFPRLVERRPAFGEFQEKTDRVIPVVELIPN